MEAAPNDGQTGDQNSQRIDHRDNCDDGAAVSQAAERVQDQVDDKIEQEKVPILAAAGTAGEGCVVGKYAGDGFGKVHMLSSLKNVGQRGV